MRSRSRRRPRCAMSLDAVERRDAVPRRDRWCGPRRPARQAGRCPGPARTRRSPSAWPTPAARPRSMSTTMRRAPAPRTHAAVTAPERRVPAVGGTRTVPEPDAIAIDYLLLGLRLTSTCRDWSTRTTDLRRSRPRSSSKRSAMAAALRDDAASLRARVADEIDARDRRTWLTAQLVALEAQAGAVAGDHSLRRARRAGIRLRPAARA